MENDKLLKNPKEIKSWLVSKGIHNYEITPEGEVNVNGGVALVSYNITTIPVQFGVVTGVFDCSYNKLTSLKGAPFKVGKAFVCLSNELTSLEHAPLEVVGGFYCNINHISTQAFMDFALSPRKIPGYMQLDIPDTEWLEQALEKASGLRKIPDSNKIERIELPFSELKRIMQAKNLYDSLHKELAIEKANSKKVKL